MTALSSSIPTASNIPDAIWPPTRTSSAVIPTYTGDPDYPVFPNGRYASRFYRVSWEKSGITNRDTDLWNECFLPANGGLAYIPAPYNTSVPSSSSGSGSDDAEDDAERKKKRSWISITVEKPDYDTEIAPCKRQAAINGNCYLQNTNGTFSGLQKYEGDFEEQQHCYCEKYPWWEAVLGCQKCFEMHGGIEGYHYFPELYISAFADTYCNANPIDEEFYAFHKAWKATAKEALIPSTTAKDVLGTQTAASLYFTETAAVSQKANNAGGRTRKRGSIWVLMGGIVVGVAVLCV
ncbi:hypothetical protein P280DRAFT_401012 [Massarina eburnea CBS 473.64]|uniref:Uncharacterized protein n=1 Tax=Massarina eburnea CBS 473.64 TaxID=1395130 RepID=A0A6A6RYA5_9PLEO|nr:hypothetical protein P280DRAFT_401012 [Massarina eburnea CBS 473.64]